MHFITNVLKARLHMGAIMLEICHTSINVVPMGFFPLLNWRVFYHCSPGWGGCCQSFSLNTNIPSFNVEIERKIDANITNIKPCSL